MPKFNSVNNLSSTVVLSLIKLYKYLVEFTPILILYTVSISPWINSIKHLPNLEPDLDTNFTQLQNYIVIALLQPKDLRGDQWIEPYIRVNTRELNRKLYIWSSTLYI